MPGLFPVENPYTKATNTMAQSAGTFGSMQQKTNTKTEPIRTTGGAVATAAGGAAAGAMMGAQLGSVIPGYGTAVGAVVGGLVGLASYYM